MTDYTSRYVKFGFETTASPTTMATTAMTLGFNYLSDFEAPVKEVEDSKFVIAGARDQQRVALLQEEPDVKITGDLMSFYPLYFAMGSISTGLTPYTIQCGSTIPWVAFGRDLQPVEGGELRTSRIWGCKVESMDLTFEKGAVAQMAINFLGCGATIDESGTVSMANVVDYTKEGIYYFDANVILDGSTLPEVSRFNLSINNNPERRLTVSRQYGYRAYAIVEGGLEVTGRLSVGAKGLTMLNDVLNRTAGHTIAFDVSKTHGGALTGTLLMNNVSFLEYGEKLTGIEPYEVEIPFTCQPKGGTSAIYVTCSTVLM